MKINTVGELIKKLQSFDSNAFVYVQNPLDSFDDEIKDK